MSESQITDPDQQRILWECLMQQRELDAVEEPPLEQFWETELLEHQRQHGPTYRFRNWFGDAPNFVRQRHRRAIHKLESAGLLTVHRRTQKRLSNIKLTDAGSKMAEALDTRLDSSGAAT